MREKNAERGDASGLWGCRTEQDQGVGGGMVSEVKGSEGLQGLNVVLPSNKASGAGPRAGKSSGPSLCGHQSCFQTKK